MTSAHQVNEYETVHAFGAGELRNLMGCLTGVKDPMPRGSREPYDVTMGLDDDWIAAKTPSKEAQEAAATQRKPESTDVLG